MSAQSTQPQINFKVTPEEAALFRRCAHRREMTLSKWIRTTLHQRVQAQEPVEWNKFCEKSHAAE